MTQSSVNPKLLHWAGSAIERGEPQPAAKVVSDLKVSSDLFEQPQARPLETHQAIHQKELSEESQKTEAVSSGFFSSVSIWSTVKVLQSVRFYIMLGAPSSGERDKTDEQLNELTGSIHAAKTLHALSPAITDSIQAKLTSLDSYESLNAFFKEEQHSLHTLVDVLLPVIYKNLAKNAHERHKTRNEQHQYTNLADVTSFICEMIDNHLSYINQRIANIENVQDEEKKNKAIYQAFSRIVDDFLAIALPDGINELPLSKIPFVTEHYWNVLQKQVLPILFYHVYNQFAFPMRENKKEILLQMTGGESLVSLAKMASEQTIELLPQLFSDSREENHDPFDDDKLPLVVIMARGFSSLLDGTELFKTWTSNWFAKELTVFSKSDNAYLKKLWKLLGGYVDPLLNHVFATMVDIKEVQESNSGRIPDAIGIILIRLLSLSSRFHHENHKLIEERIERLKQRGENYKEDEVLLKIFRPFADDMLSLMGLVDPQKLPLPEILKGLITGPLNTHAPAFLLRQYIALLNMDTDDHSTHRKLRSLLFDPRKLEDPEMAIKILSILHKEEEGSANLFNEFHHNIWQESGTEKVAKTLEAMCSALALEVVGSLMNFYGISDQTLLKKDDNPLIAKFNQGLVSLVERAFLKILVHTMETVEESPLAKEKHPKFLIAFNIMGQLIGIVNKRLKSDPSEIEMDKRDFVGLAADLYAYAGVNPFEPLPFSELPGAESLKNGINAGFKNSILPKLIEQIYFETMGWQFTFQDSLNELDRNYHTTHSKWVCKVIAQYATDYVRHYLRNSDSDVSTLLLSSLKSYFGAYKEVTDACDDLKNEMECFLRENLQKFSEDNDPEVKAFWLALTNYFEAAAAKFLAEFSKTIREIELENPDLTVDIAVQLLKDTARHFSIVTKTTQEAGVEQSFEVPLTEMINAFGKELHDGVPLDLFANEAEKDRARLQGFFIPLAAKLFKLADLSIKDLPLPKFIRQQLGELTVKKILPVALLRSFQKLLEPQIRNALMLNMMQTLYAAFNGNELAKREGGLKEAPSYPDPKQKHLYETCGYVVLELVKLIPDTAVQYILMKEKVKNMSAQAIGDALMPYLSRWTLLQMFDKVIYTGLPNFHPSKWEGKLGREDLVPLKAFVRPDGNMELKKVKEFKFHFPSTEGEIKAVQEAKVKEAFEVRMELRNAFTKTIGQQLRLKAWVFVKSLWIGFQDHLNDIIERMFSQNSLATKTMLDKIFRRVFFDVIGTMLQFLFAPLIALAQFVSEKTVIDRRSEDIIENMQSDLLENLVYKWTDTVFDSLIRLRKA